MSVHVSFKVVPMQIPSAESVIKQCDWQRLVQTRLQQQYPDISIESETPEGEKLVFLMEFKNRPTTEADIRSRLYDFMRYNPAMKIQSLEVKLLEGV